VYTQIGLQLNLAVSTIRSHLHKIYTKLDVIDRAQAVLRASEMGWI
jgi:DNA-binding NarL/FixJ family response regulator